MYITSRNGAFWDWECKDTLAALVSTCTSISDPALDALWKYPDDSGSLHRLLEVIEQTVSFLCSILSSNLAFRDKCTPLHLHKYFNRVQAIRVFTSCWRSPLPSLFMHLPQPVFPHLTKLIFPIDSRSLESDLFLVPGLRLLASIVSMVVNSTSSALGHAFCIEVLISMIYILSGSP